MSNSRFVQHTIRDLQTHAKLQGYGQVTITFALLHWLSIEHFRNVFLLVFSTSNMGKLRNVGSKATETIKSVHVDSNVLEIIETADKLAKEQGYPWPRVDHCVLGILHNYTTMQLLNIDTASETKRIERLKQTTIGKIRSMFYWKFVMFFLNKRRVIFYTFLVIWAINAALCIIGRLQDNHMTPNTIAGTILIILMGVVNYKYEKIAKHKEFVFLCSFIILVGLISIWFTIHSIVNFPL